MAIIRSTLAALAVATLPAASALAAFEMEAGKWEFQTVSVIAGMPQPQTKTQTKCITQEETDPNKAMEGLVKDGKCAASGHQVSGNTHTFDITCTNPKGPEMKGQATLTGHGDRVEGKMTITMQLGPQAMAVETKWTGKRLGKCD